MSTVSDFENGSPNEKVVFSFTELPADPDAGLNGAQKAEAVRYLYAKSMVFAGERI